MSTPPRHATGLRKTSPSRLAPQPSLRPVPSLSSLHIHGHNLEPLALPSVLPTSQTLESSASSVFTVDPNDGILLQSEDTETEEAEEITALSRELDADSDRVDKRILRDQLRRTLNRKASGTGGVLCHTSYHWKTLRISPDIVSLPSPAKGNLSRIADIDYTPGNLLDRCAKLALKRRFKCLDIPLGNIMF